MSKEAFTQDNTQLLMPQEKKSFTLKLRDVICIQEEPNEDSSKRMTDKPGSQRGLPDGWTRFTVTVPIEMAEDLKDLAYTERLKLKDVVVRAFEEALKGKDLIRRPDRKVSEPERNYI